MNDLAHQRMVQEAVKKKFGSHKVLVCKYQPLRPEQAEREYQRVAGQYMRLLNGLLKENLPKMLDIIGQEKDIQRHDDNSIPSDILAKMFDKISDELNQKADDFGFRHKLEKLAKLTRKLTIKEWKKAVGKTLGIDLTDDYYLGEIYRQLMTMWVEENVDLIKTIPHNALGEMRNIVLEGYRNGVPTTRLVKEIQKVYSINKRHARLIARDQIAKLNGQIAKMQQEDAGVTEYVWSTSNDQRVRESHRALNNKRFKWSEPPIVDEKTGRRCHPGQDYQCRCCALPVFDFDTVDLPIMPEVPEMKK